LDLTQRFLVRRSTHNDRRSVRATECCSAGANPFPSCRALEYWWLDDPKALGIGPLKAVQLFLLLVQQMPRQHFQPSLRVAQPLEKRDGADAPQPQFENENETLKRSLSRDNSHLAWIASH
jgi:hypothetical protein